MNRPKDTGIICLLLLAISVSPYCPLWGQGKAQGTRARNAALVSIVGCESDGQIGPLKAPAGRSKTMAIPAPAAQRLAYYKAENGFGVLAPKGWHCFGTYGSNGANLYVSPDPINAADLFSTTWKGFPGPVIQFRRRPGTRQGDLKLLRSSLVYFPHTKRSLSE